MSKAVTWDDFNRKRKYGAMAQMAVGAMGAAGLRLLRRHRYGTRTRTVRRRTTSSFNQGYSIVNRKAYNSKKRRPSKRTRRRMKAMRKRKEVNIASKLMEKWYKRMALMNEIENCRGRVLLPNVGRDQAPVTGEHHYLPLLLMDITNVDHNASLGFRQLYYDTTLSGASIRQYKFANWVYIKNDPDGETSMDTTPDDAYAVSTTQYMVTSSGHVPADGLTSVRKVYFEDVVADLIMYGQTNQDTLYRIDVVKFTENFEKLMDPYYQDETGNGALDSIHNQDYGDWKKLWHSLVAPYTQNPIIRRQRPKVMNILKSYKFKIPEQSSEFQQQPCVKTRIRIPINQIINRYWHSTGSTSADTANVNPESAATLNADAAETGNLTNDWGGGFARPSQRVYLMIRATNTDKRAAEGLSINVAPGQDPTFDINIRAKMSYNPV